PPPLHATASPFPRHPCVFSLSTPPPPRSPLFPYTTLFRSRQAARRPAHAPRADCPPASARLQRRGGSVGRPTRRVPRRCKRAERSEEHTSELQSLTNLVCRLLLEKKKHSMVQSHSTSPHCN